MSKDKKNTKKVSLLDRLRYKYRLIILNEDTFEQKASFLLSRMNLYVFSSVILVCVVLFVTFLIAFTPLKYYLPGVGYVDIRTQLLQMEQLTDSLGTEVERSNFWISNFHQILNGDLDESYYMADSMPKVADENIDIESESEELKQFKEEVAEEIKEKPLINNATNIALTNTYRYFFPLNFIAPVEGVVTSTFDNDSNHLGIDIAGEEKENVRAVESGAIIVSDWNPETGYVVGIQHNSNTISFYKHNAKLLKKVGSFVKRGDVIALMGNTGKLSSGPHLHFELWKNGKAIDPLLFFDLKTMN